MNSQPEGRRSTDRRIRDNEYQSRGSFRQQNSGPARQYSHGRSNGHNQADPSTQYLTERGPTVRQRSSDNVAPPNTEAEDKREAGHNASRKSRGNGSTGGKTSAGLKYCGTCGDTLTGQFVRALGGTYHLNCFRCRVCYALPHNFGS